MLYNRGMEREERKKPSSLIKKTKQEELNMKKKFVWLLVLAMILGCLAGCGNGSGSGGSAAAGGIQTTTQGKLTVATSPDFAPMEFVDASKSGQDQYVGFDITLAKYIAQEMGLELVISPMDFNACQAAVSTGSVDMAISGFSWMPEREENYNLSDTYHAGDNEDGQTTVCLASAGDKYKDAPSVEGLKVGVQGASLQEYLAKDQLPNAEVVVFQDLTTGAMQLRNGDFDIMACADGNADAIIAANSDLALTGFDFEVDPKFTDNLILLKKGNDELTQKVNEILAKAVKEDLYPGWYAEAKQLANTGTEISYDENGNPITSSETAE